MIKPLIAILLSLTSLSLWSQVPDFTAIDTEGDTHRLYAYLDSGNFVVLDFFFTNCSFCQYYAPQVQQSFEDFGCNRGNTIFMGIDYGDSTQQVAGFGATYGLGYPLVSGLEGGGDSVISLFGVTGYPTLMLIGPQGDLLKVITSPTTELVDTILFLSGCLMMPCDAGFAEAVDGGISIYPNPVKAGEEVSLHMPGNLAGGLDIRFYAPDGSLILYREGARSLRIPAGAAPGHYPVVVTDGRHRSRSMLIVTE